MAAKTWISSEKDKTQPLLIGNLGFHHQASGWNLQFFFKQFWDRKLFIAHKSKVATIGDSGCEQMEMTELSCTSRTLERGYSHQRFPEWNEHDPFLRLLSHAILSQGS